MARRHALVSLRHDAPSFFIIIIKYYYLKRDDKLENVYDVWWLLYQRIITRSAVTNCVQCLFIGAAWNSN